jgi:hypothetical protein
MFLLRFIYIFMMSFFKKTMESWKEVSWSHKWGLFFLKKELVDCNGGDYDL